MGVTVKRPNEKFKILYELPEGTNLVICIGGRGAGKSYEASKFVAFSTTIKKKRCVVLRDEKEKIRESILNEIFKRYDTANAHGHLSQFYDKLDNGIRNKKTREMVVFTEGFRASSNEKRSNLKGVSDVDIAVVEEAEDIRSYEKFNTFRDSMRKPGRLIIVMLNTPDVNHWIVKRYFDLIPEVDQEGNGTGYFILKPKPIERFVGIVSSYKDNLQFLPEDVIADYESYGDPNSEKYDLHYYKTQILGMASSGRRGQIFTKIKKISLEEYLKLPYTEVYGLDFGESSPAGIIGAKFHRNSSWARELNYKPMDALKIGKFLSGLNFSKEETIIADSARPLDINKLGNGWPENELTEEDIKNFPQLLSGFRIYGALKPPGSIKAGISLMKGMDLYIVEGSQNFEKEIQNYIWAVDRNQNPTDEPVDDYNHLIDPWRYLCTGRGRIFFV